MKNAVIFSAVFSLLCAVIWVGGQAFATEQNISVLAQNQYGDEGRLYEQGAYPGYEGQHNQEQPELPPPPEGDGQYNQEPPLQPELPPLPGGDGQYNQEPPGQQYETPQGESPEGRLQQELPPLLDQPQQSGAL